METTATLSDNKKPQKKKYRALKILGKIFLGLLIFFILLVLFVRSPWGQSLIKDRLVSYISNKTNTKVEIDKLFITFDGDIQLDGLFLEDKQGDTLVYSKTLEANIALWEMIRGTSIGVDALDWEGVRANIIRKDTVLGYNFEFLLDVFTSSNTETDSIAAPMQLILGNLDLKDFDIIYKDDVAGIDMHAIFAKMQADMRTVNPETLEFRANDLKLADANINFTQNPIPKTANQQIPLPTLSAETLALNNVKINYQSFSDRIALDADITELYSEIPNANLTKNTLEVDALYLKNSTIKLYTQTETNVVTETIEEVAQDIKQDIKTFEWPAFRMAINNLDFENNTLGYFVGNAQVEQGSFNENAILLNDFYLIGNTVSIQDKSADFEIKTAKFNEASGYHLKEFSIDAILTDQNLEVKQIIAELNDNKINGELTMQYPKLSALIEDPEKSKIALNFSNFQLNLKDLYALQPDLKNNQYFNTLSQKYIIGNIKASGYLSDIQLSRLNAFWGSNAQLSASGHIQNITKPDQLQFTLPNYNLEANREAILLFIDQLPQNITLPENVQLTGNLKGSLSSISTNSKLTTTQGIATIEGEFNKAKDIAFDTNITIENYKLNELLNTTNLGTLSANIEANGKGKTINDMDAMLDATISSFQLNAYTINNLKLKGNIKDGKGKVTSKYKDNNLNANLIATVILDSIAPEINAELDIIGADLNALGLTNRNIKTGLKLYADFKGNLTNYDVATIVDNGVVVYDNKTYLLGDINSLAHVRKDSTSVSLTNKLIDVTLESNTDPLTFSKALQRHVSSYFYRDAKVPDTLTNPVNLKLRGHIAQAPLLNDVFLVNVKDLDTVNFAIDFNEIERILTANITAPHINYSDYQVDSLALSMDTDKEKFIFNFGFKEIKAGPINMHRSIIKGEQLNNELSLDFLAYHEEEELMNIKAQITGHRDRLRFHIEPDNLLLNKAIWDIPNDNEIIITKTKLEFNDFIINKGNQSVEITDKLPSISKTHIALDYKNFELSEVFDYLNPDKQLASGVLSGSFIIEEPYTETGLVADLDVSKLQMMDVDMGTLNIDAKSLGGNSYDFNAALKGGDIDLQLTGDYLADVDGAKLDLTLDIKEFKMKALTGFSQGEITETDGSFMGNFKVNGTPKDPKYQGSLNFKNADFKIAMFNSAFTLANETLTISNEGLSMTDFTVLDENKNTFVMSGVIGTETFLNPTFDLDIKATRFQLLNATQEDNDFLYGKATIDAEAKISGDLEIPKIDINATVNSNTDVTYVMPSATVNIEERDGVVIFVNRENPDAILTRTEEQTTTVKGFDIAAVLNVGKDAAVTIVIDKETGDNFKVAGEGDFNFTMNPNGRMNLVGVYNVSSGHYEMNLYNLVNRRFEIAPGSLVSWSGDPFDAKLDVKAIYAVETSASGLMAPAFSSIDASEKGKYRQVLPFYVYLNIDGELMAPKISFNLDMPEDERGAIGGQVFGRVQQINQQEDELNRQVFSLLVLNRFYPDPGSDGSRGGVASIARDNLNDALSDQLNIFSDKLFGKSGIELDFGLDSYTDYQGDTPQDRTQLDIAARKKLFDDRLIVSVGSELDVQGSSPTNEATPLIGNVSLEYILTENGRYRIKGFRRNEFENVIDGQTIVTGIALIFTQEFNKFDELWDALFKSKTAEEKEAKEKQKKAEEALKKKEEETTANMKKNKN